MAINSSGAVSLIGTTSGQSIEYELGGSGSTALGLLCTGPRALSHVASGAVTMPGCFYSKHAVPSAPTIGSATACGGSAAKVSFTAPSCVGASSITGYTATSCPGSHTGTGSSSPITVGSLSSGTSYTFKVKATNSYGSSPCSSASNSVSPAAPGSQTYTSGTYTWVAPAGVTSVSVVVVGAGYSGSTCTNNLNAAGALSYKNNITVVPGNSYTVKAGQSGSYQSYFCSTSLVRAGIHTCRVGDGGGNGGNAYCSGRAGNGGGGAGGYSGAGGCGGYSYTNLATAGSGGGGSGGGSNSGTVGGGGGGGVGLFGQGGNGSAGGTVSSPSFYYGLAGGGGSGGSAGTNGGLCCSCGIRGQGGSGGGYGGGRGSGECGCSGSYVVYGSAGAGAVRIVWPGNTRQFPSTCVGSP